MFLIYFKERKEVFEVLSAIDRKHRYYVLFKKKTKEEVISEKDILEPIKKGFEVFITKILVDGKHNDYVLLDREHIYGFRA